MTPRRKETNFVDNQPVRFYKIIALTFLVLTVVLFAVIVFMSSKQATITVITKSEIAEATKFVSVGEDEKNKGVVISQDMELSKKYNPTGTREELDVATGFVTLHNETEYNQPLVATTRLLTPDGILFRLRDRVSVPAGGTIGVAVYADEEGKGGNIGPVKKFIIPGLRQETQALIYASSDSVMTGGVKVLGVLSTDDLKKAEIDMLATLEKKARTELEQLNPDMKMVYSLVESSIATEARVGEEVAGFELTGKAVVVGVFYNDEDLRGDAQELLNKRKVTEAEDVEEGCDYSVSLDNYNLEEGSAVLKLFVSGEVRLNPESDQVDKMIFYGKTKDEIRRYLLSLDHVHGVEIKFKPAWMHTVPHVAEHVQVIVKDVE